MTDRVVVGVDGSPHSMAAARWAGTEAAHRGAELHVLTVWQAPISNVQFSPSPEALRLWEADQARQAAQEVARAHPEVKATVEQLSGTPSRVLLEAGASAAVLVLGCHGIGTVAGFLYGSVALQVLARSGQPVVLVKAYHTEQQTQAGAEIVVGVDPDSSCDALLEFAFRQAAAARAVLRVVHVVDVHRLYGYAAPAINPLLAHDLHKEHEQELTHLLAPFRNRFGAVVAVQDVPTDTATHALVHAAGNARLLVVGRRTSLAPHAARIGPVTHGVVHHAPCPVAVVPHP